MSTLTTASLSLTSNLGTGPGPGPGPFGLGARGPVLHVVPDLPGDGSELLPPLETELVARRLDAWREALRPQGPLQDWLCLQVVTASVRIDGCQAHAAELRRYEAERALRMWDEDRRREAEELGARLARDPARVRLRLEQTRHGAEWLSARWTYLALRAEDAIGPGSPEPRGWTDDNRREALDLLGVPRHQRPAAPGKGPTTDDHGHQSIETQHSESSCRLDLPARPEGQAAFARAHVARLAALRERALDPLDDRERTLACQGQPTRPSGPVGQLQRLEARLRREQKAALDELRRLQGQGPVTRWVQLGKEHAPTPLHPRPTPAPPAPPPPPAPPAASPPIARPAPPSRPPVDRDAPSPAFAPATGPDARPLILVRRRDRRRGPVEPSRPGD